MKVIFYPLMLGAAIAMFAATDVRAAIVAQDNFESYAPGSFNGQGAIGAGWASSWTAKPANALIATAPLLTNKQLELTNDSTLPSQNGDANAAYRSFTAQSGNDVYFGFDIEFTRASSGDTNSDDFAAMWIDLSPILTSDDHADVPNIGIKFKGNDEDGYFVRLVQNNNATVEEEWSSQDVAIGSLTGVRLMGHLSKSGGSVYNSFSLSLYDSLNLSDTVIDFPGVVVGPASIQSPTPLSTVDTIGFRVANLENKDRILIDNIVIATEVWEAGPTVPEPATLAIWSLGLGIAGLVRLRRKS